MRRMSLSARRTAVIGFFGLTLAACGGLDVLLELAATVDLYFEHGDFGWDAFEAADVVGKVLGSGMLP